MAMTVTRLARVGAACYACLWLFSISSLTPCHASQSLMNPFRNTAGDADEADTEILTTVLSDKDKTVFPLVGLGVGNLQHNLISEMIADSIQQNNKIRLVDTAHASRNEHLVAKGIVDGVQRLDGAAVRGGRKQKTQFHVVTKIWYTYLGYERTKLSVQESLNDLKLAINDDRIDLKVHFLLHWPRCDDKIPWMNCEKEEQELPSSVRIAGPPPHLDKDNAWKGSWKALEDMFLSKDIASIGVSNFSEKDMRELSKMARVQPHMVQLNVWALLHDPYLMNFCRDKNIHVQVYNVMNGIVGQMSESPHAHHHILKVANELMKAASGDDLEEISATQVILKWLAQTNRSIIPRTTNKQRLHDNSAVTLSHIPPLSEDQIQTVHKAARAIIARKDLPEDVPVKVTFHAKNQDMYLYWVPDDGGKQKQITYIEKGQKHVQNTHPNHNFRVYNAYDPDSFQDYSVTGGYGDHSEVHLEL